MAYAKGTTSGLVIGALVLNFPFVLIGLAVMITAFPKLWVALVVLLGLMVLFKVGK